MRPILLTFVFVTSSLRKQQSAPAQPYYSSAVWVKHIFCQQYLYQLYHLVSLLPRRSLAGFVASSFPHSEDVGGLNKFLFSEEHPGDFYMEGIPQPK